MTGIRLAASLLLVTFSGYSFAQDDFSTVNTTKKSWDDAAGEQTEPPCLSANCGSVSQSQVPEAALPSPTDSSAGSKSSQAPQAATVQKSPESLTAEQKQAAQLAVAAQQAASNQDWTGAIKDITAAVNLSPYDSQLQRQEAALLKLAPKDILKKFNLTNAGQQAHALIHSPQMDSLPSGPEGLSQPAAAIDTGGASSAKPPPLRAEFVSEAEWQRKAGQLQSVSRKMGIGDYQSAKIEVTKVLHQNPRDWTAHTLLGQILLRQPYPDYRGAKIEAQAALSLHPNNTDALEVLASAVIRLDKNESAAKEIEKYLPGLPEGRKRTAEAYFIVSEAYRRVGQRGDALKDLSNAASSDPQQFQKLYERALAAYDRQTSPEEPDQRSALHWGGFATLATVLTMLLGSAVFLRGMRSTLPTRKVSRPVPTPAFPDSPFVWSPGAWLIADKYRLVQRAGAGGMGEVWEAYDAVLQRRVAVKHWIAPQAGGVDRNFFLKEARTVAKLKHPNIVAIHDVQDKPELFLVFEYVEGRTLDQILEGKKRLSLPESLHYLKPVCRALIYTHGCKVIHRDLKPSNIMVPHDGAVKVMDFGIARDIKHTLTMTNTPMGTPVYMAPEMKEGFVSPACDVYSLAVMLYEMVAGELPSRSSFRRLTSFVPGLSAGIDEFIAQGLETNPNQRIPTVKHFLAALEKAAFGAKSNIGPRRF